jgi:RNA polymerase sigma factor (TIGR02999 family)
MLPVPAYNRGVTAAAHRTTLLLNQLGAGDRSVEDELVALVYGELRRLAAQQMSAQARAHTLQPTALVHEAWLRLVEQDEASFESKHRFFALAARVMRSVLVDHARARGAAKRGGGLERAPLDDAAESGAGAADVDVLALDEALEHLAEIDADLARLVELRFYGGLSHPEIAAATGVGLRTVERRWRLARAWLRAEIEA